MWENGLPNPDESIIAHSLIPELRNKSKESTKNNYERYMKGVIPFIGLKVPETREVYKKWRESVWIPHVESLTCDEAMSLALSFYWSLLAEVKLVGTMLLADGIKCGWTGYIEALGSVFDSGLIYDWATCDTLCSRVLSKMKDITPDQLKDWALNPDSSVWKRRASLVTFISRADKDSDEKLRDDLTEMASAALVSMPHERFCQTAVGWIMRQISVLHRQHVLNWIENVGIGLLTREGLSYTLEKMPINLRKRVMTKHFPPSSRKRKHE